MTVLKPMLAHSKSPDLDKIKYPVLVQPKLDGVRCMIVDNVARSRTFKEIPNKEISRHLSQRQFNGLDGELLVGDPVDPNAMQATTSFVMAPNKTGGDWKYYVFDYTLAPEAPYTDRANAIEVRSMDRGSFNDPRVVRVPAGLLCLDRAAVEAEEERLVSLGYEGAIIRDPNGLYKFGRSGSRGPLLKLKRFTDAEAMIVGYYEELHNGNEATKDAFGRTERSSVKANKTGKARLGGFEVEDIITGVRFNVGSGYTADDRLALWDNPDQYLGQVIKYKSFPVGVKDKPRHPVFLGFRNMEVDG